jgi:hypothetical protein
MTPPPSGGRRERNAVAERMRARRARQPLPEDGELLRRNTRHDTICHICNKLLIATFSRFAHCILRDAGPAYAACTAYVARRPHNHQSWGAHR